MTLLLRPCVRRTAFTRSFATLPTVNVPLSYPAKLPDLPYGYGDLEPVFPGKLMELHHGKHHAAYVANFNKGIETYQGFAEKGDLESMVQLHKGVSFNAGGHVNHSIFWTNLAPIKDGGGAPPTGDLASEISAKWGSLEKFQEKFNGISALIQGSGWGWLAYSKEKGLHITTSPNQDLLSSEEGLVPLLAVDVWEHAYYVEYENRRPDYLKNIWKIVNWQNVSARYEAAKSA